MKFKRLATILMAAAMMVSLVACTGDNGENSETPVASGNDVVEETETNHITLAESWGFENFYTIMTPDVSASNFGITYYLSNFYDIKMENTLVVWLRIGQLAKMERSTHSIYGMM